MASYVRGEVNEVSEERLRRREYDSFFADLLFHVRNIHVSFHSLTDPSRGTSTIRAALKGMQQQSTARAVGAIVVITQLQ